ncbi:unnamed protein product [Protopolystoma xenopodis]|uniref:Uncharacterized protein n=1 Tax=Protopolystoma xenopodis TaxID=117903 RepID=A0A3S5AN08_9PLAT|nr:unnamed protein product [Protopolystoma xenopodis]
MDEQDCLFINARVSSCIGPLETVSSLQVCERGVPIQDNIFTAMIRSTDNWAGNCAHLRDLSSARRLICSFTDASDHYGY